MNYQKNDQTNGSITNTGGYANPTGGYANPTGGYANPTGGYAKPNWRSKALPREVKPSTSLCIPRMEASVSRDYIYSVFNQLNIGHIEQMNEIPLRNERDFKRILLRIRLNNSDTANTVVKFLKEKGYVNIVHNMPWFWKLVEGGPR